MMNIYDYGTKEKLDLKLDDFSNDLIIVGRLQCDDKYICSITGKNWRTCHMGFPIIYDENNDTCKVIFRYVSAEGYNSSDKDPLWTHWIPLYINDINWKYSKIWLKSGLKLESGLELLNLLVNIINDIIYSYYTSVNDDSVDEYRHIMMLFFGNMYRLVLYFKIKFPKISKVAEGIVKNYIYGQNDFNEKIIWYLCFAQTIKWQHICGTYLYQLIKDCTKSTDNPTCDYIFELLNNNNNNYDYKYALFIRFIINKNNLGDSTIDTEPYDNCWGYINENTANILYHEFNEYIETMIDINTIINSLDIKIKSEHIIDIFKSISDIYSDSESEKIKTIYNKMSLIPSEA